ncbi:MAG: major capsid protein [Porphyromonadaceae bacterium]|nr:major capsid protein [Porphyromonadaceae bacterium]
MKGSQGIPSLQLTVLNKLITAFVRPASNFFTNLFTSQNYDSDTIDWEIQYGSGGMTPFVAPGSVAPSIGIDGMGEASAKAAYWKEKMYFDEEFLNNLREPGTPATYMKAERQLARGAQKLRYRCDRRREWMVAKMILDGVLSYTVAGGTKFSVSYGIPTSHMVTLDDSRNWKDGASKNCVEDIFDAKQVLSDDARVIPKYCIINSQMMKVLLFDTAIQALLAKSAFGNGDLFANPEKVIGQLLGVGTLLVYDELYEVQSWLTQTVTGTTIYLDDVSDFEVGGKARFVNMKEYNSYEDEVITEVDKVNGTIKVGAKPSATFVGGRDKVVMRKKFIQDNEFLMFSDTQENMKIAEFMQAPYGNGRRWGFYADTKDEWDPEGIWLRVQDKGLPVLYYPDTTYKITAFDLDEY